MAGDALSGEELAMVLGRGVNGVLGGGHSNRYQLWSPAEAQDSQRQVAARRLEPTGDPHTLPQGLCFSLWSPMRLCGAPDAFLAFLRGRPLASGCQEGS